MKLIFGIVALIILTTATNLHAAANNCGVLNIHGREPHDYNNAEDRRHMLPTVEAAHFSPNIENLSHGNSGPLGSELSYTLLMFPNHPRALTAISKLALREKTLRPHGSRFSSLCFFDRAIRFKPRDGAVRAVYSNYLLKLGKTDEALGQLKEAINLQPENPTFNYNLGLLYVQKKDYEQAKTYAKKAYGLGFPLPGLKNKLMEAGKWED